MAADEYETTELQSEPFFKLEPGGSQYAPLLSYNVPEPTTYTCQNIIELEFPESYYKPEFREEPDRTLRTPMSEILSYEDLRNRVDQEMKTGFTASTLFPNARLDPRSIELWKSMDKLARPNLDDVVTMLKAGKRLNIYRSLSGELAYNYLPEPEGPSPRVLLVETYQISSFLGNYGAGRTLNTFTLLPSEEAKISISTYRQQATSAARASCVLDSFTHESAREFESAVQAEQADKRAAQSSFQYNVNAEAGVNVGYFHAKVEAGLSGSTNASREQMARNVSAASRKHVSSASSKRDVQISSSYQVEAREGEETSTVRTLKNVNVARTLNFVFRQMNQEYITILHLVDVRVAFFNGYGELSREVPLYELDRLLNEVVVGEEPVPGVTVRSPQRAEIHGAVINTIRDIVDYKGELAPADNMFIDEKSITDSYGNVTSYWRINRQRSQSYREYADESQAEIQTKITVPGIILAVEKHVLRTDGVIVEAILGQGNAVDKYTRGSLVESLRAKKLANNREELAQLIVTGREAEQADIYQKVYGKAPEGS